MALAAVACLLQDAVITRRHGDKFDDDGDDGSDKVEV